MVNYVRSEFYRTIKNKNFIIMIGVFAALIIAAIAVLTYMPTIDSTFRYANTKFALANIYMQMTMLFTVIVAFAAIIDNGECSNNTIKHSISFGISRNTIYSGRLIVQAILSIITYVVMSILLIVLAFLFLEHSNMNEVSTYIKVSIGGGTCLLATLTVAHFFIMNSDNQVMGLILPVIIMVIIPSALNLLGRKIDIIKSIAYYLPYNLVAGSEKLAQGKGGIESIIIPFLVGLLWSVVFIILGMVKFNKKEIK